MVIFNFPQIISEKSLVSIYPFKNFIYLIFYSNDDENKYYHVCFVFIGEAEPKEQLQDVEDQDVS